MGRQIVHAARISERVVGCQRTSVVFSQGVNAAAACLQHLCVCVCVCARVRVRVQKRLFDRDAHMQTRTRDAQSWLISN